MFKVHDAQCSQNSYLKRGIARFCDSTHHVQFRALARLCQSEIGGIIVEDCGNGGIAMCP